MKKLFNKLIDETFDVGILLKFLHGFFEILGGLFLASPGRQITDNVIVALTRGEIAEDQKDFIANYLIKISSQVSGNVNFFAVFYLIFHGIVNAGLAIALLKNKLWAYPLAIVTFIIFTVYQIYRYSYTYSLSLLLLTLFDVFLVVVVYLEYKKKLKIGG